MSTEELRLLPWPGANGQRAYLSTGDPSGFLSLLADRLEAEQLAAGAEVLKLARVMLDSADPLTSDEMAYVARRLAECLADALRVAESRGDRLPVAE
ncbi:hypothetical protein ACFYY3_08275 [Streptomyces sp. NPDC001812]|uniref:hypothetical protein n=1 Tax=Streptomyces sp. NPDC001812 TaxID=3364611 RepID=UPI00369B6633